MSEKYIFDQHTRVWVKENYVNRIQYCDGTDIEQRIFDSVKNSKDVSVLSDELESHIFDWASLCFLSKRRSNLLRPFADYLKGKHILEPGCGAGPVTRFLGECGAYVYAVEPNIHRAKIAAERCRDLDNVKVFCDDIEGFAIDQRFDGIIMVGVLEYATKYSTEANAPLLFINHLKQFLKEDGFLITAIENQLGLKYFSGYMEDHVGVLMHGINDNYHTGHVTTFGKEQLLHLFEEAGFATNRLFLPFPDYKLPSLVIFPDLYEKHKQAGDDLKNILSNISYMDPQRNVPLFSMDKALPLIAQNGLIYDLSNSFCLLSQLQPHTVFNEEVLWSMYNTERRKEFCKETVFVKNEETVNVVRNYLLKDSVADDSLIFLEPAEPVYKGTLYHYELVKIVNQDNWTVEQVTGWMKKWLTCLQSYLIRHDKFKPGDFADVHLKMSSKYIDALPINLLMEDDHYQFIDMEIDLNREVELGYILFRTLFVSFSRLSSVAMPSQPHFVETEPLLYRCFAGLGFTLTPEQLNDYYEQEAQLVSSIAAVNIATVKGSVSRLKVRNYILYSEPDSQAELAESRIHRLPTGRKRMLKQFIKRTFSRA